MLLIRSLNPFLCLTVILITFNLKSQSQSDCAGDKQKLKYVYFIKKTHTNRERFILFLKDDIDWYPIIPDMDKSAVQVFTLSMDTVKVVYSN